MATMKAPDTPIEAQAAAKALLAFWRAAGVDMDMAEAVYAASAAKAGSSPAARSSAQPAPKTAPVRAKAKAAAPIDSAVALAKAARNVAELREAVLAFEGCALKATARNTVFSDGVDDAPVLVIGEAPGRDEDQQGKPFVGPAGAMLDRMLAAIGLSRQSSVLISNTIYWRPPGDRDPTPGESLICQPFVERLIELKQPKLLVLVGKAAAQAVLQRQDPINKLRGRKLSYAREELALPVNAIVMLHPAYLMRQPQQKRQAWADLLAMEAWLAELGVARVS
jgi:DNA polymerase